MKPNDTPNEQPSDAELLARASMGDSATALRQLLEELEPEYPHVDGDRLARAAIGLRRARHHGAPAIALAWLQQRPSLARLAVVCGLLMVSWSDAKGQDAPQAALLETLLDVYAALKPGQIDENGVLLVLIAAARSGLPTPLAERVRPLLETARRTPDREPMLRALLDAYLK